MPFHKPYVFIVERKNKNALVDEKYILVMQSRFTKTNPKKNSDISNIGRGLALEF